MSLLKSEVVNSTLFLRSWRLFRAWPRSVGSHWSLSFPGLPCQMPNPEQLPWVPVCCWPILDPPSLSSAWLTREGSPRDGRAHPTGVLLPRRRWRWFCCVACAALTPRNSLPTSHLSLPLSLLPTQLSFRMGMCHSSCSRGISPAVSAPSHGAGRRGCSDPAPAGMEEPPWLSATSFSKAQGLCNLQEKVWC